MSLSEHNPKDIFAEALRLKNPAEHAAYLDRVCAGNPALRQEVESLLIAHAQAGDFLDLTRSLPAPDSLIERTGTMIGRYKLLQQIGEGGFGVVYMAEQVEPVQRKVALKIIKAGMDSKEVIARFEAERQALALMDHPGIANILDAGATEAGRPYFVMELVNGIPITDYCDLKKLPTAERLQLFMKVCHAVQHAHQKGIIHRDLKPSNVLVTLHDGDPVPKVIDFGVAKAPGQKLTAKTLFTGFAQMLGTPAYMSPEQAELSGLDIDTRSDIYTLGVLLYELLTGVTPFDKETLAKVALDEIRRMIRETEPPKPSTRLETLGDRLAEVAKYRHTEPATLSRQVRGDLDWIVMKALEKDRQRRYESADSLAEDLSRHLRQEPVSAAAPTFGYRLSQFARRNRVALSLATAFGVVLLAGAGVSLYQARRAVHSAREAEQQRSKATEAATRALESLAATKQARESAESHLYASRMALAERHWEQGDVASAEAALDSCPQELRHWEWNYLKRQCHLEQVRFNVGASLKRGDLDAAFSIQFVADGKSLAVAGPGVGLSWFDPADGRRLGRQIQGLEPPPSLNGFGGFSKDGRYFFWPWAGTNQPPILTDLLTQRNVSLPDLTPVAETTRDKSRYSLSFLSATATTFVAAFNNGVEFYSLPSGTQRSLKLAEGFEAQAISSDAMRILLRWSNKLVVYDRARDAFFEFPDSNHKSIHGYYPVSCGAFDSKAQRVAVTWSPAKGNIARDSRTEVELWEVSPPRRLWRIVLPGSLITPVFCANDRWLVLTGAGLVALGEVGSELRLPDLAVLRPETGELLRLEQADNATAHGGRFLAWGFSAEASGEGELFGVRAFPSPDQRTLALQVFDRTIHLLDLESGRKRVLRGHSDLVSSLSFSPDARRLASIDCRGEVRIWDLESTDSFEPESWSPDKAFELSHNGRTVLWWTHMPVESLRVLDLDQRTLLEGPNSWPTAALAPDGTWLFEGTCERRVSDGSIIRWLNETNRLELPEDRAISENGRVIVRLYSTKCLVEVGDAMSSNAAATIIRFEGPWEGYVDWNVGMTYEPGHNLALSSSGELLALVHRPREIRIYRVPSPGAEPIEQCRFAGNPSLAFGPKDAWILAAGPVEGFQKVAVSSGNVLRVFPLKQTPVRGWEISPNGRLAICYAEGLPLVDLESGLAIPTEGSFEPKFHDPQADFSPDGLRLAFPGSDRRLKVWSTTTRSLVTSLAIQSAQARFSSDGQRLTVVSPEGGIRLLDGASWTAGSHSADLGHVTRTRLKTQ